MKVMLIKQCAWCGRIMGRVRLGAENTVDKPIVSHGICLKCAKKFFTIPMEDNK